MMAEKIDFCDGKYTVINDNGKLTALRHGEIWGRDLVGDNLVYWMFVKARDLQEQNERMLAALKVAVQQNYHDMILTGEELRQCEEVISKATGRTE